ncbi:MAG: LacI family DNA-binding transcriptional regulator [Corynebacterium sp.]|uniref:LacI family DNA-binding transcriptional regulator n=1 Tax=Corynebacterium sp. TaxID=1720 RepID=UPI0026DF0026|nr:LacI family DNA-binding transcriptional regulator [Corynebacterium sp.]MDO5670262.1 LacI family DNA-binding transcriptional regulator [Corynebacterium sp.]
MKRTRPTMKDVAQHAGVSTATVSLVVRGSSQIPDDTAARVRASMSELGYVYNRLAGNLRGGTTPTFGLLVTNPRNPYFAEVIMSIERSLADSEDMVVTAFSLGGARREHTMATKLAGQGISGLLFMSSSEYSDEQLDALTRSLGIPVTMLIHASAPQHDSVLIDDRVAGQQLGSHLAGIGVRRVAFLGGFAERLNVTARLEGLRESLAAVADSELIHIPEEKLSYEFTTGSTLTDQALAMDGGPPDAIVCFNDAYAVGVYASLRRAGVAPGEDIAVAGFDDIPLARELGVPLTTVNTRADQIGLTALDVLRHRIVEPQSPPRTEIMHPELVVRDSTLTWRPR